MIVWDLSLRFLSQKWIFLVVIHASVVYARLQKMFDEMKTSMHRITRYSLIFYKWYQNLASNIDLMKYLVLCCFSSGIQKIMVLRMVFKWQLRLVSRFKGPFFTPQHHLVAITLPNFQSMHMCKLSNLNYQHICRGS